MNINQFAEVILRLIVEDGLENQNLTLFKR